MNDDGTLLFLKGDEVRRILKGAEDEILRTVGETYIAHRLGRSHLPHSSFLFYPEIPRGRAIALPAFVGAPFDVAGIKWISSVPDNLNLGLPRASGIVVLNSTVTGRPLALMEGSFVSIARTAASAALAARHLHEDASVGEVGIVGCGEINLEVVRYLRRVFPSLNQLVIQDKVAERADSFQRRCGAFCPGVHVRVVPESRNVLDSVNLVSLATTAQVPHIYEWSGFPSCGTVLHLSVRDLSPAMVLSCDNVVDDPDHVCRERTSLQLAEQVAGKRDFIRCTLADILLGRARARQGAKGPAVFTPFGLGVLDIALGQWVYRRALDRGTGTVVRDFFPSS